jgi:hypothetical protein
VRFVKDEVQITTAFKTFFDANYASYSYDWPGENSERNGGYLVRFRVARLPDSRFIATQGTTKLYRNYGTVLVQVIGPMGEGPGTVMGFIDAVSRQFAGKRYGGILLRTPSAGPVVEGKNDLSVTGSIPYTSDFSIDAIGNVSP